MSSPFTACVVQPVPMPYDKEGNLRRALDWMEEASAHGAGLIVFPEMFLTGYLIRDRLAEHGIPFDPKKFNPHITLVRKPLIPDSVDLAGLEIPAARMLVDEVCLYRSERGENGMEYTVIGSTRNRT